MASPDKEGVASRDSRFELLRILAMLAIVAGHFVSQSALATATPAVLAAGIVGVSLAAFAIASLIDAVRLAFLESRCLGTRPVRWLTEKIAALDRAGQGEIVS